MDNMQSLQIDLARRSFWNIGYFIAGLVFWIYVVIVARYFPIQVAKTFWLIGTFGIFPVAVLASKLIGADPFTKGNRLADLVGYTHMSVVAMTLPIVVAAYVYFPEAMLFVMAIAYCLDFYVMSWAFGTPIFGVHAATRVALVSLIWFAWPEWRTTALPAVVALAYLLTVICIPFLRTRWLAREAMESA